MCHKGDTSSMGGVGGGGVLSIQGEALEGWGLVMEGLLWEQGDWRRHGCCERLHHPDASMKGREVANLDGLRCQSCG